MNDPGPVLILGAGPTGLGAAYRLQEAGFTDFLVLEARTHPGGLATSFEDDSGFTWDVGGHVHFSHYGYYDAVFRQVLGDRVLSHERQSWVWLKERFVPYPFQYNLHRLDPVDQERALRGLEQAAARHEPGAAANFHQWIVSTFGGGIAELFMFPYNLKVWGYPLDTLSAGWIGERVAVPDLARVARNLAEKRDDVAWGPNNRFLYPERGGTGAIWQGVASLIRSDGMELGARVVAVDLAGRRVHLEDGRRLSYRTLISSVPLDRFCSLCRGLAAEAREAARNLVHSTCHLVGVGLRGGRPKSLEKKCWMYFPEPHSPYYRVTVLSNYSPHNTPPGDDHWSLLTEVCESPNRQVAAPGLGDEVLRALRRDGLLPRRANVVSLWHRREEHGYPTPFLERDQVLATILPGLEAHDVYSRGRFGAWKYEVSNQDHSFMQGVELADRLLGVGEEVTLHHPETVNRPRAVRGQCPEGEVRATPNRNEAQ